MIEREKVIVKKKGKRVVRVKYNSQLTEPANHQVSCL